MILAPNILCIVGVFTMGFGIIASVVTNNVAALAALANGVRPMRKVAALEAERRHLLELQLRESGFLDAAQDLIELDGPVDLDQSIVTDDARPDQGGRGRGGDRRRTRYRASERRVQPAMV